MEITQEILREKINNGEKVIVDFHALWCGPCKMMKPTFEKISNENTTEVQMYTMDVDKNRELAIELGIRSVPTIKTFNGSQNIETKVGLLQEAQLKQLLNNLV